MEESKKNLMTCLLAASICCAVIGTKSSGSDNVSPQAESLPELPSSTALPDQFPGRQQSYTTCSYRETQYIAPEFLTAPTGHKNLKSETTAADLLSALHDPCVVSPDPNDPTMYVMGL